MSKILSDGTEEMARAKKRKLNSGSQERYRSARASDMKTVIPVLPSSGGTGIRLKVPRSRFSTNRILRNVDAKLEPPASTGSVMFVNEAEAGARNTPAAMPMRIAAPASSIIVKFAAGPARDLHAARRRCSRCQEGSYVALAQPIIHPPRS